VTGACSLRPEGRWPRSLIIAAVSLSDASLRGGVERAAHLPRDAMHGAGAYADFTGDFEDAIAGQQMLPDALFKFLADARPTQRLTGFHGPL